MYSASLGDFPDLLQAIKEIGIEHLMLIGSVEPFDKGILARIARLNVSQFDVSHFILLTNPLLADSFISHFATSQY
jgi:hypothetical protein